MVGRGDWVRHLSILSASVGDGRMLLAARWVGVKPVAGPLSPEDSNRMKWPWLMPGWAPRTELELDGGDGWSDVHGGVCGCTPRLSRALHGSRPGGRGG